MPDNPESASSPSALGGRSSLERKLLASLAEYEAAGLKRSLRAVERVSARECRINGRLCLDFSSNDYLGLSFHPKLREESIRWTSLSGCGSGASRLISGTSAGSLELEERIARWKGFEASIILGSGYSANVGVIQSLLTRSSAIFADKLNHASLNAGCILSQADFKRYRHNDAAHLARMLSGADSSTERLVITDSVFSMDGDIAPLAAVHEAASSADAMLLIDDAHASGVMGERGHGLAAPELCDVAVSTFSKAMGSYGACVSCSAALKDYFVSKCGPFIYSTALPPSTLGTISAAVDFVQTAEAGSMRSSLMANAQFLRDGLAALGFGYGDSETMIVPVIVGGTSECLALSKKLLEKGVFAPAVRPPTVPQGTARLRVSVNAAHSRSDIERLLEALSQS